MDTCGREYEEAENDVDSCNKKLDDNSKASLKAALGSMLLAVGLVAAEGAFATTTMPTIVVTATPSDPGGPVTISPCPQVVSGGVHANTTCGSGGTGGGGSGTTVTLAAITVTAKTIKCQIQSKSWNNNEYLAMVYLNSSGALTSSNIVSGTGTNTTTSLQSLGVPTNTVQTMVHNHPVNNYGNTPGEYVPSKADWQTYNNLKNAGNPIQGQFILGPDGVFRYFDGSNQNYPATSNYPGSGGALPTGTTIYGGC